LTLSPLKIRKRYISEKGLRFGGEKMVGETCAKCGAKIPAGGKFCLECGTPVGAQQAPAAAPVQAPARGGFFDTLFSKTFILVGALLGILLAWIGSVIFAFGGAEANIYRLGVVLNSLGYAALSIFLIGGAISNKSLDKFVRLGMVFGGAVLLAMGLAVSATNLFGVR